MIARNLSEVFLIVACVVTLVTTLPGGDSIDVVLP
jgi:hypothetical protein